MHPMFLFEMNCFLKPKVRSVDKIYLIEIEPQLDQVIFSQMTYILKFLMLMKLCLESSKSVSKSLSSKCCFNDFLPNLIKSITPKKKILE